MADAWDASGWLASIARARAAAQRAPATRLAEQGGRFLSRVQSDAGMPVLTGSLRDSGKVRAPSETAQAPGVAAIDVVFGGETPGPNDPVAYAEPVHEGFDLVAWGHPTGRHIEGRPYLEAPLTADGASYVQQAGVDAFADIAAAWRA